MTTSEDMQRVLLDRANWGRAYQNHELETKRRSAVIWLRNCSNRGWVCDRILTKPERRK